MIASQVNLYLVSKQDLLDMPLGTQVFVYNAFFNSMREDKIRKFFIGYSKYCADYMRFYITRETWERLYAKD